jgi:hypothetical protein
LLAFSGTGAELASGNGRGEIWLVPPTSASWISLFAAVVIFAVSS